MLEIKNITKIYHSKNANDVVALDNVSINFGDKGLVFLLGKSGSGKSTVLNTIGGLDSFDKGEIIINGKSSSTFTAKDFDSYRNTYVGFIFQEYNVLPEFTVEKNIALALELQGKTSNPQAIDELLESVDLKGYGKRKPNQLSGGQKQRIAIARALVKSPEIIMADEPTGALDSKTGIQVFETLKKLSKDKLVIVVSHDRENAEIFADRIIELKDGRVISDRVKKNVSPKQATPNVDLIQNNLVRVNGGQLTPDDRKFIDKLVSSVKGDIYISASEPINHEIKRAAKINEYGQSSVYVDTERSDILVSPNQQEFKLIRGRMRTRDSMKMGASSLKAKRGKLVVAIMLSIFTMLVFGFADAMASFDAGNNMYKSIQNSENQTFALTKEAYDEDFNYGQMVMLKESDVSALQAKYPNHTFAPCVAMNYDFPFANPGSLNNFITYRSSVNSFNLSPQQYETFKLDLVSGNYPTSSGKVAITLLEYEIFKQAGYMSSGGIKYNINNYSDIIGKEIAGCQVTGIIDTKLPQNILDVLLQDQLEYTMINQMNLMPIVEYGMHLGLFFGSSSDIVVSDYNRYASLNLEINNNEFTVSVDEKANKYISTSIMKNGATSLQKNQVIVDFVVSYYSYNNSYYINALNLEADTFAEVESIIETRFSTASAFDTNFGDALSDYNKSYPIEVVGVTCSMRDESSYYYNSAKVHAIESDYFGFNLEKIGDYNCVITKLNGSNLDKDLVISNCNLKSEETKFLVQNEASGILYNFYDIFKMVAQICLYIGIAFALFSMLLIMSFIANSISYKKKEIGVLRALGATGGDVYRIFTWESLFIVAIIFVISCVLLGVGCLIINLVLKNQVGLYLSIMTFGIRQVLLLGGVCLLIGVLASWLPTRKISKMKPIDAIQERK